MLHPVNPLGAPLPPIYLNLMFSMHLEKSDKTWSHPRIVDVLIFMNVNTAAYIMNVITIIILL